LIEAPQEPTTEERSKLDEVPEFGSFIPTKTFNDDEDEDEDEDEYSYDNGEFVANDYFEEGFIGLDGFPWFIDDQLLSALKELHIQSTIENSSFIKSFNGIHFDGLIANTWLLEWLLFFTVLLIVAKVYKYINTPNTTALKIVFPVEINDEENTLQSVGSHDTLFESFGPSVSRIIHENKSSDGNELTDFVTSEDSEAPFINTPTQEESILNSSTYSISSQSVDVIRLGYNSLSSAESTLNFTFLSDEIANSRVETNGEEDVKEATEYDIFETLKQFDGLPLISEKQKQIADDGPIIQFGECIEDERASEESDHGNCPKEDLDSVGAPGYVIDTKKSRAQLMNTEVEEEKDAKEGEKEENEISFIRRLIEESDTTMELESMSEFLEKFVPESSSLDEKIEYFETVFRRVSDHSVSTISEHEPQTPSPDLLTKVEIISEDRPTSGECDFDSVLQELEIRNHQVKEKIPRKQSILRHVFEPLPPEDGVESLSPGSKIPVLSNEKTPRRKIYSPRPRSQKEQLCKISDSVMIYLLNPTEPNIDGYLIHLFGEDPHVVINLNLLETLSKDNIDTLLRVYEGKETSENWKERYENFDLLIGHLRYHEPELLYQYFESQILENIDEFLDLLTTKRSKLLEKVILFTREIIYYGVSLELNDEIFVMLIHRLIPLTKSTSKFIYKLSLKSLCLMIQSVSIGDFLRCLNPLFADILSNKKLKIEKFTCLFMIKFYIAAYLNKFTTVEIEEVAEELQPFVTSLSIDSYQKTRSEIVEIYLIIQKKIPRSPKLMAFYEALTTFLKSKVKKPEYNSTEQQANNTV